MKSRLPSDMFEKKKLQYKVDCCARWIWQVITSSFTSGAKLAKTFMRPPAAYFGEDQCFSATSNPLQCDNSQAVVMRAELEECGGAVVILPTSLPTEGWTATVLVPTSQHRMQEKVSSFPSFGSQCHPPCPLPPNSSSFFSASCLHQSQAGGFLVVWGFPRWWLHVPLPHPCIYSPVDKAPGAWALPRRLNPRDLTPWNLWNGWLHRETPRPRGLQPGLQWWLSNKDRRRGEGRGKAKAFGGDQGGGDWEHHKCQPSWWRLGLVGGLRLLHDPHRRWVRRTYRSSTRSILSFQPMESPTPSASSSWRW